MPRKTTKTACVNPDIIDDEGVLCLKGDIFWRWRALNSEFRAAEIEMEQTKARISIEIAKHQELAELFSQQAGLMGQLSIAKAELIKVQNEIEERMNVSLKDCAFDDRTGRLYNFADGTRGDPVKPPKRHVRKTKTV